MENTVSAHSRRIVLLRGMFNRLLTHKQTIAMIHRFTIMPLIALAAMLLAGCGSSRKLPAGDPAIEQQLDGTWTATHTQTEYEDGEKIVAELTETVTFDSSTKEMTGKITIEYTYPFDMKLCTVSYAGKWSADAESLTEIYDKGSLEFKFHTGLLDKSEKEEFKSEMSSDLEDKQVTEIRSITPDRLVVFDGEDEITYYRQ